MYAGSLAVGCGLLTFNNIVILGFSITGLLRFNLPFICIASLLAAVVLTMVTRLRLRPVRRALRQTPGADAGRAAIRLIRLPYEVFAIMLLLVAVLTIAFHVVSFARQYDAWTDADNAYWAGLVNNVISELAIGLTLALLFFSRLRGLSRYYLLLLHPERAFVSRQTTFMFPLMLTYGCGLVIVTFQMLRYVFANGESLDYVHFFATFAVYFAFALLLYVQLIGQFSREVGELTGAIRRLLGSERTEWNRKMAVTSNDEIGGLAIVFNEMQEGIAAHYQTLEDELRLAAETQIRLLRNPSHTSGSWRVGARFQPAYEVGGDLYDVVVLDEFRTAVLIGDVSGKGPPAALLMSAALTLFRSEVRRGGSAGAMLGRLNRTLAEMVQGELYVTLGLAVFDAASSTVAYASAGHVAPYLISEGSVEQLPVSSLPAGIDADESYAEETYRLDPGGLMVLYTDGVVESCDPAGDMLSFDRFAELLKDSPLRESAEGACEHIWRRLPVGPSPDRDDRTLLVVAGREGRRGA